MGEGLVPLFTCLSVVEVVMLWPQYNATIQIHTRTLGVTAQTLPGVGSVFSN
jgi:hypothetical protein